MIDEVSVPGRRKPEWAWREVIRLAARLPQPSCRQVADLFNRLHGVRATMRKSQTAKVLAARAHDIAGARRATGEG